MFEHLYPDLERSSNEPQGCYVSFRERMRERLIAGVVGIMLGAAGAALLFAIGVAS